MEHAWGADAAPEQILEHLQRTVTFLDRHQVLWRAHVVEFFQDRLWEVLDSEWLSALQNASTEELLSLPSFSVKDHWPSTLKDFLDEARFLASPRTFKDEVFNSPHSTDIEKVVSEGMNPKKMHEIGLLSSLVADVSTLVNATEIIDVGAGQGYLAQVLAFQYKLPVVALDCSAHNTGVTSKRAERIQRYYQARNGKATGPKTVTSRIGSDSDTSLDTILQSLVSCKSQPRSAVLAGLHACGDLSANMLRTFVQSNNVAAVVSIGCCYNLVSERAQNGNSKVCGFPMSEGMRKLNFFIGGAGRDLGCQCAERWKDSMVHVAESNFQIHAFRAAFQLVLHRFYTGVAETCPSVGRIGKAKRRKQSQRPQAEVQPVREDAFLLFSRYTAAALGRLNLPDVPTHQLLQLWEEVAPFLKFIGPFWSIRAALGPVLETLLLLDRLLYLKEECRGASSMLVPVFNPRVSPRNVAILATRQ